MSLSYIVYLPPEQYTTCSYCNGSGEVEMERDLHRSAGIIPCPARHCGGGKIISESVSAEEYESRKAAGTLYKRT